MIDVTLGFELEWIGVSQGIEVDRRCISDDSRAFGDDIAFVHDIVVGEMSQYPWRGRTETQDFFETCVDVGQIGEVIVCWGTSVADDCLKLLGCLGLSLGCRSKVEYQVGECSCRRLRSSFDKTCRKISE